MENDTARDLVYSALCSIGYKGIPENFSRIAKKSGTAYKVAQTKIANSFLQLKQENGGTLYSVLIELGEQPLYSKSTKTLAKKVVNKLFGTVPHYAKVERMNSVEPLVHVHVLALLPDGYSVPESVNAYSVSLIALGAGKYAGLSIEQNVRKFTAYLLKPADARADRTNTANRKTMYLEWFIESFNVAAGLPATWDDIQLRWGNNLKGAWERYKDSHISMLTPLQPTTLATKPKPISKHTQSLNLENALNQKKLVSPFSGKSFPKVQLKGNSRVSPAVCQNPRIRRVAQHSGDFDSG